MTKGSVVRPVPWRLPLAGRGRGERERETERERERERERNQRKDLTLKIKLMQDGALPPTNVRFWLSFFTRYSKETKLREGEEGRSQRTLSDREFNDTEMRTTQLQLGVKSSPTITTNVERDGR